MTVPAPEPLSDNLVVRPAAAGEEGTILDLLSEAATWLRSRGIEQWPRRFPVESVRQQIAAAEALLAEQDGRPVATVAVSGIAPDYWTAAAGSAFYFSRLAVARAASGAGLGYRIIDWLDSKAVADGRAYLRLATAPDNQALRRYYEQAGFRHVGDPPEARWPTSLYQRPVGPAAD